LFGCGSRSLPLAGNFSEKIRMAHRPANDRIIEFGGFRLDPLERSLVSADGEPVHLTRRLYDTLLFMVERPGRLIEKQALLDAVWKGSIVEENTLSRTISALRQALGGRACGDRYIETVSGLGYRFVQSVTTKGSRAPEAESRETAIAVLPFEDLSRARDQDYFADGIAEEVLNRLAAIKGLRVIAKSSAFRFRERTESAQVIGQSLGVDYLLAGAVRKEGERVRVTAQLIEVKTDSQCWSERFDRELRLQDIFAIQDDIAREVAGALSTLGVGDQSAGAGGTQDMEAYDLYLRARALGYQSGAQGSVRAAELLRESVKRDPGFAAAWLMLASLSRGRLIFAPQHSAQAVLDLQEAVTRITTLAGGTWRAHLAQSWLAHVRRDWLAMERSTERAAGLAPGMSSELASALGTFYAQINDSRTVEHLRAAVRSDPLSMLMSGVYQLELHVWGRDDESEMEYRRSLDLAGDREMAEHLRVHRLWARGEPFREQFRRYLDHTRTFLAPVLEDVYAVADDADAALELLRGARSDDEYQSAPQQMVLAWWMAHYGDVDAAFAAVWRAYVDFNWFLISWLWWPVLSGVREHERFPELLARVGLVEYWRAKNHTSALSNVPMP
jgi:adenylate cyclase